MLWREALAEALGRVFDFAWNPLSGPVLVTVAGVAAIVASVAALQAV